MCRLAAQRMTAVPGTVGVGCRGNKDAIQQALKLAMEHLDLFSDRGAQAPNSKAARAVAALDALLQDLAGSDEVWSRG